MPAMGVRVRTSPIAGSDGELPELRAKAPLGTSGAIRPSMRAAGWPVFLERLGELGAAVAEQEVAIAFHHHMHGVIEKAEETDRLLVGRIPDRLSAQFREETR